MKDEVLTDNIIKKAAESKYIGCKWSNDQVCYWNGTKDEDDPRLPNTEGDGEYSRKPQCDRKAMQNL